MKSLAAALSALLTVWLTPDGTPVYVEHAREHGGKRHVLEMAEDFEQSARRQGVGAFLLVALAFHESGLNPAAVQPQTGAWGLLQLHPRSRWSKRARRVCNAAPEFCLAAQIEWGARAFRYGAEACAPVELGALSFYRFGDCDRARERERQVLALRDRLRREFRANGGAASPLGPG